uniref:Peroxisome assembly protein 12 n=1 Tax=Parastrongyloides trichosuri TaxID=131310 RepID=A0A0N4ZQ24_PARTI
MDLKLMENNKLLFDSSTIAGRSMNLILGLFSKFGKLLSFIMIGIQVLQYVQQSQDNGSSNIMSMFGNYVPGERKSEIQFPVEKLSERDTLSLSKDQCPLCLKKRENDTVLSVSGYIFCFKCIHNYVKKYGLCPVTSTPATLNELVRLYME